MGDPVRIAVAWRDEVWTTTSSVWGDPRPPTVTRHVYRACKLEAVIGGVAVAGEGSHDADNVDGAPRAMRDAVRALREAAWRVLGAQAAPDVVDLGDAWPFPAVSDGYKRGRRRWYRIAARAADDLRDAVPPIHVRGWPGFLVGEPHAHVTIEGREVAVRTAIVVAGGAYFARLVAAAPAPLAAALTELRVALADAVRGSKPTG